MSNAVNIAQLGSNNTTFRNKIINGACVIDQRNNGASVTPANGTYTLDRWIYYSSQASKFTVEQTITGVAAPAGFSDYLGATVASAVTIGSSDYFNIAQLIEGFNIANLNWGTANAQTVTLSFWVRSSLTGTFGGALRNSAANRSYPFAYTISSANTWEQKSVTIAGDTSGTWLTNNGAGITVAFGLGVGSTVSGTAGAWNSNNNLSATGATSVVGTASATWYVTGVQLEAGSAASPFEYRSYGTELALCQRYLPALNNSTSVDQIGMGYSYTTTQALISINHVVSARVPPTGLTIVSLANINIGNGAGTQTAASAGTFIFGGINQSMIQLTTTGLTVGQGCYARSTNTYQILLTGCEL